MVSRRQAMKAFALGSAFLGPETLMRLAQAGAIATPATATSDSAAPAAAAASRGVVVRQMMVQPLPSGDKVAVTVVVEYAPGAESPPHRHPGPVFGYVLEGKVRIGIDQHPPLTYAEGDLWYEEPRHVHRVSGNASATAPARILAFLIVRKGEPILEALQVPA